MTNEEIQDKIISYGWKPLASFEDGNTITYKKACMTMHWNYETMEFVVKSDFKSSIIKEFNEQYIRDPFDMIKLKKHLKQKQNA